MNKKEKELFKQLKIDISAILEDFYKTEEYLHYEKELTEYLKKRDCFIECKLEEKEYNLTEHTVSKNGITLKKEMFK